MQVDEVKKICVEQFLVPFEGTGPRDSKGNFIAYPDPYSPLGYARRKRKHPTKELTGNDVIDGAPWTISYGMTFHPDGRKVMPGEVWNPEYAIWCKAQILNVFLKDLIARSPGLVAESNLRIAAILSWFYNLGAGNYRVSTFKKMIDIKDWVRASEEGKKWNKAQGALSPGLVKRRNKEALAILYG